MRASMLGPDCDRLWVAYLAAEREGVPGERDAALGDFIAAAVRQPEKRLDAFARAWCAANIDDGQWAGHRRGAPVRLPLVFEIVGPAVMRGRSKNAPDCARWLEDLWNLLIKDERWRDRLARLGSPVALLDEALALDPADERARAIRCRGLVNAVDYAFHELPWIVGNEAELRADLERLEALGPVSRQELRAFARYIAAARRILDGDRADDAIDEYDEAARLLKEGS
jgi:hypothetical protein